MIMAKYMFHVDNASKVIFGLSITIFEKYYKIMNNDVIIVDICGASKASESLCRNNMIILKLLSEEVFEFAQGHMTRAKMQHLKNSMSSEFSNVFELCLFVLTNTNNAPLLKSTLETLLRFCNWIPLGYMFKVIFGSFSKKAEDSPDLIFAA